MRQGEKCRLSYSPFSQDASAGQESKTSLISELDGPLGFFLYLPFHQQEWDETPGEKGAL